MANIKHVISPLTFKVAKVWTSAEGTTEKIHFDVKISYDPNEINVAGRLSGELMLVKLKEEISALVTDAVIPVRFTCNKCLKDFVEEVFIPAAEREFLSYKPRKVIDENDIYVIDIKNLTIDLTEMMRQEIILHFPLIPVCSKGCKGICPICGSDRNKKACGCKEKKITNQPFKDLKKMLNPK
jgi:uncharacterized metal-binding protein YceD (DUF177 family)